MVYLIFVHKVFFLVSCSFSRLSLDKGKLSGSRLGLDILLPDLCSLLVQDTLFSAGIADVDTLSVAICSYSEGFL